MTVVKELPMCVMCGDDANHAGGAGLRHPVTRRRTLDMLAAGGLATLGSLASGFGSAARANDDVVRIGYLPITDATALMVAHGWNHGVTLSTPREHHECSKTGRWDEQTSCRYGAAMWTERAAQINW